MFQNAQIVKPENRSSTSIDPYPEYHVDVLNAEFHPYCGIGDFIQKSVIDACELADIQEIEIRASMLSLLLQEPEADPYWSDLIYWIRALRVNSYLMAAAFMSQDYKKNLQKYSEENPWLTVLLFAVVDDDPDSPNEKALQAINDLQSIPVPLIPQSACNTNLQSIGRARTINTVIKSRQEILIHFVRGRDGVWDGIRENYIGLQQSACLFTVPKPFMTKLRSGWLSRTGWQSRKLILGSDTHAEEPSFHVYLNYSGEYDLDLHALFEQPAGDKAEVLVTLLSEGRLFCIGLAHNNTLNFGTDFVQEQILKGLKSNNLIENDDNRVLWLSPLSLASIEKESFVYYLVRLCEAEDDFRQSSSSHLQGIRS